jgi:hypothetical protein
MMRSGGTPGDEAMAYRHATFKYAAKCATVASLFGSMFAMPAMGATDPLFDTHEVLELALIGPN